MPRQKRKDKHRSKSKLMRISIFLILLLAASQLVAFLFIPPNLQINNQKLGMIKKSELDSVLDERLANLEEKQVEVIYNDQIEKYSLSNLGLSFDREKLESDIQKSTKSNALTFLFNATRGKNFEPLAVIDNEKFDKALDVFEDNTAEEPIDAYYQYQEGTIVIVDEEPGYVLGTDEVKEELLKDSLKDNLKITLKLTPADPEITREILSEQGINEKISSYQTTFNASNASRNNNMRLALSAINGTVLAPDEVFSFNDTVGERTAARGYQGAPVYADGKVVTGIGGGICQVSSTLYNAVLLGDFEVVDRRNHGMSVSYVPLSRDATVSWGSIDFKFKNQTDKHLYIHGSIQGNKLIFEIFSTKVPGKEVVLESQTLSHNASGSRSKLIKKIFMDNILTETIVVSTDTYRALASSGSTENDFEGIIEEAPKPSPTPAPKPQAPETPSINNNQNNNSGNSAKPEAPKPTPPQDTPEVQANPDPGNTPDNSNTSEAASGDGI